MGLELHYADRQISNVPNHLALTNQQNSNARPSAPSSKNEYISFALFYLADEILEPCIAISVIGMFMQMETCSVNLNDDHIQIHAASFHCMNIPITKIAMRGSKISSLIIMPPAPTGARL